MRIYTYEKDDRWIAVALPRNVRGAGPDRWAAVEDLRQKLIWEWPSHTRAGGIS